MHNYIVLVLVARMLAWSPPNPWTGDAARYVGVAVDAVDVAFDPAEEPLLPGPRGRELTAAIILAVASAESNFELAVEDGRKRGDHGRAWCLMQVQPGQGIVLTEDGTYRYARGGLDGPALARDRAACFRAGLHVLRDSMRACARLPLEDRLSVYTSGRCQVGEPRARLRMRRALGEGFLPATVPVHTRGGGESTMEMSRKPHPRIVVGLPLNWTGQQHGLGDVVDAARAETLQAQGYELLPVDPDALAAYGVGGYHRREWGLRGLALGTDMPRMHAPLTIHTEPGATKLSWALRLLPAAPHVLGRTYDGNLRIAADSGQGAHMAGVQDASLVLMHMLGEPDAAGGWTVRGHSGVRIPQTAHYGLAFYGRAPGLRVAWAAVTAVID